MQAPPPSKPSVFLVPYILWLGYVDWLAERAEMTHRDALLEAHETVQKHGYTWVRRLGVGAALLSLLVLFVAHGTAPVVRRVAPSVPAKAVVPASAVLTGVVVLFLLYLLVRDLYRVLLRFYARGLRVWYRQQAALYEAQGPFNR